MAFPQEEPDTELHEGIMEAAEAMNGPIPSFDTVGKMIAPQKVSKRLRPIDDPNYVRQMGPNGEEIGILGYECGSHCVVQMAGKHQLVRHCACSECHDGKEVVYGVPRET